MKIGRREFLTRIAQGTGVVLAGSLLGGRLAAAADTAKAEWLAVGKLEDYPDGTTTAVKAATTVADGKPVKKVQLLITRQGEELTAMSARCTHAGCTVEPAKDGTFECLCHGARYDAHGGVTKGPAKKPLTWFEAKVEGGEVRVNLGKEVPAPAAEKK
jgi:cytochrome b6-f complex iron-sulfur subunit